MRYISIFLMIIMFVFAKCEEVNISFKGMKIEDFLKMSAKILGKNILITQRINGEVKFISTKPICKSELPQLIISVLETKGYTLVKDNGFLKVVKTSIASRQNLPVVLSKPTGSMMVTKAIKVKDQNVDVVVQKIRHLISPAAKIVTMKQTNTLILTDYPKNIQTINKVIKILSTKNSLEVKFIKLKYAKASVVSSHLNAIAKTLINQAIIPMKINIITDDTTNSLIIVANKNNIQTLKNVIDKLDTKEDFISLKTEVITLKNSEAKGVTKILSTAISKMGKSSKKKSHITPTITAEEELNALIITATKEQIKEIKELVKKLDIPRQQVYVKAKIVEISEKKANQIGLRYGLGGVAVGGDGLYTFSAALTGSLPTGAEALAKEEGKNFAVGIALNFLATNGAAEILSEPSILCVNNKESTIYVGETRSILVSATAPSTGGQTKNYKRQDVGLTLAIKPRLSTDNKVSLDVKATLEGVQADTANTETPTTTKRSVTTTAIVNDGEEVIIGGLIKKDESANRAKIPFLGDIPFLGGLFRGDNYNKSTTSLVIILTPYIVKSSDDLEKLKQKLVKLDRLQKGYSKIVLESIKNHQKITKTKQDEEEW